MHSCSRDSACVREWEARRWRAAAAVESVAVHEYINGWMDGGAVLADGYPGSLSTGGRRFVGAICGWSRADGRAAGCNAAAVEGRDQELELEAAAVDRCPAPAGLLPFDLYRIMRCHRLGRAVRFRIARGGAETVADNCRSHMIPRTHTGRANEPALPGLQQCPEAPSRINRICRVAVVLVAGTVLLDPWVHSATSLAHHPRPPPQTIADPISERSRPNVTMCCCSLHGLAIPPTSGRACTLLLATRQRDMRKGSHAGTPSC